MIDKIWQEMTNVRSGTIEKKKEKEKEKKNIARSLKLISTMKKLFSSCNFLFHMLDSNHSKEISKSFYNFSISISISCAFEQSQPAPFKGPLTLLIKVSSMLLPCSLALK